MAMVSEQRTLAQRVQYIHECVHDIHTCHTQTGVVNVQELQRYNKNTNDNKDIL